MSDKVAEAISKREEARDKARKAKARKAGPKTEKADDK